MTTFLIALAALLIGYAVYSKIVDAAMVEALSKVPGKDQLRATLLMLLKEPATRLARVLSEKAKKEGGEAPAA